MSKMLNMNNESELLLDVGILKNFDLEPSSSAFTIPSLTTYFSDELAKFYEPLIYAGDYSDPPPEGIYYRIIYNPSINEYCIQYYVYWLEQNCLGHLNFVSHTYDYEPIFLFIRPPQEYPVGVVNGGLSKALGAFCRFHKIEVRRKEYITRDPKEYEVHYSTASEPYYPFGKFETKECVKRYPLPGAIYFDDLRPIFGIVSCSHVFSGAESDIKCPRLSAQLKRLNDDVLNEWYKHHHNRLNEEPFGHDVSNPFEYPYIKYFDPKPILQ
jgi:hypothetical protein